MFREFFLKIKMSAALICFVTVFVLSIGAASTQSNRIGEDCEIGTFQGRCTLDSECASLKMDLPFRELSKYINRHNCGWPDDPFSRSAIVCCPETETIAPPGNLDEKRKMDSKTFCNKLGTRMDKTPRFDDHIVNGELAKVDDFPQFASLATAKLSFSCGGALISRNFVLTAAHCLLPTDPVTIVRLGTNVLNHTTWPVDMKPKNQIRHPWYRGSAKYHDIGLVELEKNVVFNHYVWPACLYQAEDLPEETLEIAGFGLTHDESKTMSNELLKGNATEVPLPDCIDEYELQYEDSPITGLPDGINGSVICANDLKGKNNACQGDSGSGLHRKFTDTYEKRYLVGLTSAGFTCVTDLPSFFTRVYPYLDWIESIVWP